ncbi:hypothetical protein GCM10027064_13940 [Microbacterium petrolearium]
MQSNEWSKRFGLEVYYASVDRLSDLWAMYVEIRRIRPDVVYLNSLYNVPFSVLPRLLVASGFWGRGMKVLLAPRGELDPGALQIRALKKRVFNAADRVLRLAARVTWHASSTREERHIRSVHGADAAVVVRENETLLPERALSPSLRGGPLRAVFVSRLSPKKGLLTALQAMRDVDIPMEFDVYGPVEDARYVAECRAAAERIAETVTVRFRGALRPEAVRATLHDYDAMLFPTAGENFGHVIAESLSAACPVVTNDTTPWTELLHAGAGVVVPSPSVGDWRAVVVRIAAMSPAQRLDRRRAAAAAYESWRSQAGGAHVFDLLRDMTPPVKGVG